MNENRTTERFEPTVIEYEHPLFMWELAKLWRIGLFGIWNGEKFRLLRSLREPIPILVWAHVYFVWACWVLACSRVDRYMDNKVLVYSIWIATLVCYDYYKVFRKRAKVFFTVFNLNFILVPSIVYGFSCAPLVMRPAGFLPKKLVCILLTLSTSIFFYYNRKTD